MNIRAALLPAAGTALRVVDLELAEPGPGEVLVRLAASGVCIDDLNVLDGTVEVPCPVVPGHEGAGVVERLGEGVERPAAGRPRGALLGALLRPLRAVPARPAAPVRHRLAADAGRRHAGRHHAARVRRRDRPPLLLPVARSQSARWCPPARACGSPTTCPFEVAALLGCAVTSGVCAVWRTAGVRPGERVAVFGLGGTGLSAVLGRGRGRRRPGDCRGRSPAEAGAGARAGRERCRSDGR